MCSLIGELTAICVWGQQGLFANDEARIRKTKEIADKLLALDPKLAEGHTALSWCHFMEHDWAAAEDEIVRAIELDPNYPFARDIYVFYLSMLGRTDEAQRQAQRSRETRSQGPHHGAGGRLAVYRRPPV